MWRIAGFTGAVGIEVALAIAIGYFGGQWLDRKLGTAPVLSLIGFAAGIGAAIKALIRVTRNYQKKILEEDRQHGLAPPPPPSSSSSTPSPQQTAPDDAPNDPHGRH